MIILLTGGSGCGKSACAERIVAAMPREKRIYIATMQVADNESRRRVERHIRRREGMDFTTVEQYRSPGEAPVEPGSVVLLEDLPNLLANEMFGVSGPEVSGGGSPDAPDGGSPEMSRNGSPERIMSDLRALADRCAHLVIVTNDVFSDGGEYDESTQEYIRRLAELNRAAADLADCAAEVLYGIPVPLKGVLPWV